MVIAERDLQNTQQLAMILSEAVESLVGVLLINCRKYLLPLKCNLLARLAAELQARLQRAARCFAPLSFYTPLVVIYTVFLLEAFL